VTSATDLNNRMQFHNYAQSGRALKDMSESAIVRVCNSACLIVSLGYNDWSLGSDTDDTVFSTFKQRIDWLIQYSKVFKNLVVVQDFIWYATKHSRTRRQLKRLADAVNGIYIPYPDQFFNNSSQPIQSPPQLNDPLYLWADAAHPNALGNELIYSTIATALGFSVNSKNIALQYYDWPFPLKIASANFNNTDPTFVGSLSTIQQVGDSYQVRLNVKLRVGGSFPANTLENISTGLPLKFRNGENVALVPVRAVSEYNFSGGTASTYTLYESPATVNVYSVNAGTPGTTKITSSSYIAKAI
jgi:hypothetical protein